MSNVLVFVLELIGTAAFAVSGAIVGIKKQMDLFGVIVLGVCTAVGGGIVRDVILGITPPATFHDPVYTLSAAAVSVLMFLPHVRARVGRHEPVFDRLLLVMDAVGLGVFTVVGVQCAYRQAEHDTLFLTVSSASSPAWAAACCATCSPASGPISSCGTSTPARQLSAR